MCEYGTLWYGHVRPCTAMYGHVRPIWQHHEIPPRCGTSEAINSGDSSTFWWCSFWKILRHALYLSTSSWTSPVKHHIYIYVIICPFFSTLVHIHEESAKESFQIKALSNVYVISPYPWLIHVGWIPASLFPPDFLYFLIDRQLIQIIPAISRKSVSAATLVVLTCSY